MLVVCVDETWGRVDACVVMIHLLTIAALLFVNKGMSQK